MYGSINSFTTRNYLMPWKLYCLKAIEGENNLLMNFEALLFSKTFCLSLPHIQQIFLHQNSANQLSSKRSKSSILHGQNLFNNAIYKQFHQLNEL